MLNAYPLPTPGFRQGANNVILNSDNPQDQRKDNIRFDYRLNDKNQFTFRHSRSGWTAVDAFRGTFPSRSHPVGSAESDDDRELDQHALQHAHQRVQLRPLAR